MHSLPQAHVLHLKKRKKEKKMEKKQSGAEDNPPPSVSFSQCQSIEIRGCSKAALIIQQTLFSRRNAVQSNLLIFDDAIWHRDQNRLHPVCIVRPETEPHQRRRDGGKDVRARASVHVVYAVHAARLRMGLVQSY